MIFGHLHSSITIMYFQLRLKCFSVLRLCITNLRTFQHGHLGYLGALQKTLGLNHTSYFYDLYILDFENVKVARKPSDFRLTSVKNVWKQNPMPFSFFRCCTAPMCIKVKWQVLIICLINNGGSAAAGLILYTFSALSEMFLSLENKPSTHFNSSY